MSLAALVFGRFRSSDSLGEQKRRPRAESRCRRTAPAVILRIEYGHLAYFALHLSAIYSNFFLSESRGNIDVFLFHYLKKFGICVNL